MENDKRGWQIYRKCRFITYAAAISEVVMTEANVIN